MKKMGKRILSMFTAFAMMISLMPAFTLTANAADITSISSLADLEAFRDDINNNGKTYEGVTVKLTADIDMSGTYNRRNPWTPIGKYSIQFKGTFDGQGHTIKGFYFERESYDGSNLDKIGLFSIIGEGGTVKNLGMIDPYINSTDSYNVGVVCGRNNGTIENCSITGTTGGSLNAGMSFGFGGMCGDNNGIVKNCRNTFNLSSDEDVGGICGGNGENGRIINCYNTGEISGCRRIGGVCGRNYGTITNCYNTGAVSASWDTVGGFCAINEGTITNSYNTGAVSGNSDFYGFCADNSENGTITNCYYLDTLADSPNGGASKTAEEFASGEIAWVLQDGQTTQEWGQSLSGTTDAYPVLTSESKKKVCKVTFMNGEVEYDVRYVNSTGVTPLPDNPSKEGYEFEKWSTSETGGTEFTASTPITEDMTVYAVYADNAGDAPIKIGDYVQMGTYNEQPILWRCVAFEKVTGTDTMGNPIIDSTQTSATYKDGYLPLMLADALLCNKKFDEAGSVTTGSHGRGRNRTERGSNYWADSNIRDWLNSADSTVTYTCGNAPSYSDEAGFLTNFSMAEKTAMNTVTQKSILQQSDYDALSADKKSGTATHIFVDGYVSKVVQNYSDAYSEQVTDTMFLMDVQQLYNVYTNDSLLGSEKYENYYKPVVVDESYWLRTPTYSDCAVRVVQGDGKVDYIAADCGILDYSVRPAFFFDTTAKLAGSGTETEPYTIVPPHMHKVCNDEDCEDGHEDIIWTAWESDNSLPTEAGNYYLTKDVHLSQKNEPENGVRLCLNGHSVDVSAGGQVSAIIINEDITFELCDCAETGGKITGAAASTISNSGTFNMYSGKLSDNVINNAVGNDSGSGVDNYGIFNMYGGEISGNTTAANGGGVNVFGEGVVFNMYGGEIKNNSAKVGGGVCVSQGTANIYGGTISGNSAAQTGGGVNDSGTVNMYGGEISGNSTTGAADGTTTMGCGGGVHLNGSSASFTMHGGTISGNTATGYGGGVYKWQGDFKMYGGEISGNSTAQTGGGGVYIAYTAPAITVGGTSVIKDNKAKDITNNVYMYYDKETILIDEKHPLEDGAEIGVTYSHNITTEINITGQNNDDYSKYFKSDNENYVIKNTVNVVQLAVQPTHVHDMSVECGHENDVAFDHALTSIDGVPYVDGVQMRSEEPNRYILNAGNYYLAEDMDINAFLHLKGRVNICLNGHTIQLNEYMINIELDSRDSAGECSICDCGDGGKITGSYSEELEHMALITNTENLNIYGGKIENTSTDDRDGYYQYAIANARDLRLYGGEVVSVNDIAIVSAHKNMNIVLSGTPIINGAEGSADISLERQGYSSNTDNKIIFSDAITVNKPYKIIVAETRAFTDGWTEKMGDKNFSDYFVSANNERFIDINADGELEIYDYAITSQPTEENDYTVTANSTPQSYQWYKADVITEPVTTENAELFVKKYGGSSSYDSESGSWQSVFDSSYGYFNINLVTGDILKVKPTGEWLEQKASIISDSAWRTANMNDDGEYVFTAQTDGIYTLFTEKGYYPITATVTRVVLGDAVDGQTTNQFTGKESGRYACVVGYASGGQVTSSVIDFDPPHTHSLKHYEAVDATCTEAGNGEYWKCEGDNGCNKMFSDQNGETEITEIPVIAPTGHEWGNWMITKDPTLTTEGTAERVCTKNSAHKYTAELPVLTDTEVWKVGTKVEPTETSDGSQEYISEEYGTVTVVIPALSHTHEWGNWTITKDPTLTTEGTAERVCKANSEHKDTVTLPALTDTDVWTKGDYTAPTADADGSQEYTSEYGTVTVVIPALSHTHEWGNWTITKDPTLTTEGTAERVCKANSEHKDTVTLPALTDTDVWTKGDYTAPTADADGSQEYTSEYGTVTVILKYTPDQTELKPGESVTIGDTTVTNGEDGTVTITSGDDEETVITLQESKEITVGEDGTVTVPDGSTVKTGDNGEIKLPQGGSVDADANVSGESVVIDDTTITAPEGEKVTTDRDGNTTVPSGGKVQTGDNEEVTVPSGGSVDKDGNVEGEKVVIDDTTITAPEGEKVVVDKEGNTSVPKSSTIEKDDTIVTITEGDKAVIDKDDNITFPDGGKITVEKDGKTVTVDVPVNGKIDMNDLPTPTPTAKPNHSSGGSSYKVTFNAGENGKITKGNASVSVSYNSKIKEASIPTVTANEGYKFIGWSEDGKTVIDPTMTAVKKPITFTALYEAETTEPIVEPTPTPEAKRHEAYIVGYNDGTFRPDGNITRAETAAILARLTDGFDENGSYEPVFPDVASDLWYSKYIGFEASKNIISGYPDGTFNPEASITRAEFAVVITKFANITAANADMPFADTDGHWAFEQISACYGAGYIAGYEDNTFRPDSYITRAEAVAIINRVLDRNDIKDFENTFADVNENHWAYADIMEAAITHNTED